MIICNIIKPTMIFVKKYIKNEKLLKSLCKLLVYSKGITGFNYFSLIAEPKCYILCNKKQADNYLMQ